MVLTREKRGYLTSFLALVFLLSSWQTQPSNAANILGLFTSTSPSHLIVHMSVVKALAENGHNITVVVAQKPKVTHTNIKVISVLPTAEQDKLKDDMMREVSEKEQGVWTMTVRMFTSMSVMIDSQFDVMSHPSVRALYEDSANKFDLVIMGYFMNDFILGAAAKLKAPVIVDWTTVPMDVINKYAGNPYEWAYVPNFYIGAKPGESMTFTQRVKNTLCGMLYSTVRRVADYRMESYYHRLFPGENLPTLSDMRKNVSMVFCNSHFSEGPIRPNVPGLVEIGGIQIKDKPSPLPQDIESHLNASSKHGAILFCLGSNIKSSVVNQDKMIAIYNVLSKLKQNVIWKWEDEENTPGKSKNILYKKWIPQDDILAHRNMKLFITHAGKGGLVESQYHGVPMVAIPIFGDQNGNAQAMVASGYGLQLKMLELTESDLKGAVEEVLQNRSYSDSVKRFSKLYRDRPLTAKQSVVYWAEYVMRHHGAAHMQSPLVHMNYIQALNLDVLGLIFSVIFISIKLLKFACKFVCSKIWNKPILDISQKLKKQ